VRTIDSIDSSVNHTGQSFRASLDAPIVVGDRIVVPKGLNVFLKLVDASSAGKFKGRSELTVSLDSFTYQGKTYQIASSDVQEKGGSRRQAFRGGHWRWRGARCHHRRPRRARRWLAPA
jgi:hypothetical protein